MLTRINAWLTSPDDYDAGLTLLRETGYAGFTLTVLAKGDDAYNRTRLEAELRKWVSTQNSILPIDDCSSPGPELNSVVAIPKKPTSAAEIPENQTSAVVSLRDRTYSLMDERAELKARLRAKADDESAQEIRREWAYRIKAITRELDEVYSQLDFHDEHGYLPVAPDPAEAVDDTAALMNARSYVSRYRTKLKKKGLTPEQRQSYETLLTQYSAEKERLERKLKHDTHTTGQQTTHRPNDPASLP